MLMLAHQLLAADGLLFLALPLSCLTPVDERSASRMQKRRAAPGFTRARCEQIFEQCGYRILPEPDTRVGEKVVFYCLQKLQPSPLLDLHGIHKARKRRIHLEMQSSRSALFHITLPEAAAEP
jgi:hypothetical protein